MIINNTSVSGLFTLTNSMAGLTAEAKDVLFYDGKLYKVLNDVVVTLPLTEFVASANVIDLYKDNTYDPESGRNTGFLTAETLILYINTIIKGIGPGGLTLYILGEDIQSITELTSTGMYYVSDPATKKEYVVIVYSQSTDYKQFIIDYTTPALTVNICEGGTTTTKSYSSFIDITDVTQALEDMKKKVTAIVKSSRIAKMLDFSRSGSQYIANLVEAPDKMIVTICVATEGTNQVSRVVALDDSSSMSVQDDQIHFTLSKLTNRLVLMDLNDNYTIVGAYYY